MAFYTWLCLNCAFTFDVKGSITDTVPSPSICPKCGYKGIFKRIYSTFGFTIK